MKYALIATWLGVLLSGICYIFWQNEVKYTLPTPVPVNYQAVNTGASVNIDGLMNGVNKKPLFIHFFNPACPCSRFNIPYFRSLAKDYGNKISFAVVVLSKDRSYTEEDIQQKFDLDIPVYFDSAIAAACGVYSTPQAVLLDEQRQLYYRGNYNKSRYCTDPESNYAQQAIDSFLNHNADPVFNAYALKAYGCELPLCTK